MRIEHLQDRISDGDIFAFEGTAFHSRLIQYWTRSVYSHIGLAVWVEMGGVRQLCILEAMEGAGVRLQPAAEYLRLCEREGCRVDWYAIVDPVIDRAKVVNYARSRWSLRYVSFYQFLVSFGWLIPKIRKLLGKPVELHQDRDFCSKLAAAALLEGGYQPINGEAVNPVFTDPGALTRFACLRRMGRIEA